MQVTNFSSRCLYIVIYSYWFHLVLMHNLLLSNNSFHIGSSNNFTLINFWSFPLHTLINFRSCLCLSQLEQRNLNSKLFSSILCHLSPLHKFCFCYQLSSQICLFLHGSFLGASTSANTITWLCLSATARAGSLWSLLWVYLLNCLLSLCFFQPVVYFMFECELLLQTTLHQLTSDHLLTKNNILDTQATVV